MTVRDAAHISQGRRYNERMPGSEKVNPVGSGVKHRERAPLWIDDAALQGEGGAGQCQHGQQDKGTDPHQHDNMNAALPIVSELYPR